LPPANLPRFHVFLSRITLTSNSRKRFITSHPKANVGPSARKMANIDVEASLEEFRRFLIYSTCVSFIPESYFEDPEVFPEREGAQGSIYVEAEDKATIKKIRDITFVNVKEVLGVLYESKSGNTRLKWRSTSGTHGRVTGVASANALTNLINAGVITQDYVQEVVTKAFSKEEKGNEEPPTEDM